MIKLNVFGLPMAVLRVNEQWLLYRESDTAMRARVYDVVIPPELGESELVVYVADIYHENASEEYPEVVRLV